jgi:hypothetical protein
MWMWVVCKKLSLGLDQPRFESGWFYWPVLSRDELVVKAGIVHRQIRRRSCYICVRRTFSNTFTCWRQFVIYLPNRSRFNFSLGSIRKEVRDYKLDSCQLICMKRFLTKDRERQRMTQNCSKEHGWQHWTTKNGWMTTMNGRMTTLDDDERMMKVNRWRQADENR